MSVGIVYHPTSGEQKVLIPINSACYQAPESATMNQFELLVSKPNDNLDLRQADIYIFNVIGEIHLEVVCIALDSDSSVTLSNSTFIFNVVPSSKLLNTVISRSLSCN